LQVIDEEGCQRISKDVGTYLLEGFAKLKQQYSVIGDVRGKGLMIGVEMVEDSVCKPLHSSPIFHDDRMFTRSRELP
jgi:alanine-glyoxylate transaminase/(R)-3-amino-2-methylpropionate-pyruvate transaminase